MTEDEFDKVHGLLMNVAGFLNVIAEGHAVPNLRQQAHELLEKVGAALAEME